MSEAHPTLQDQRVLTSPQAVARFTSDADFSRPVYELLGLPFDAVSVSQAAEKVREAARERRRLFISTPNVNFVVAASKDPSFAQSVWRSNLSLIDGMPLLWLAKLSGLPFTERVAGSTLFEHLRRSASEPLKIYFFGGEPGVAKLAAQVLNEERGSMVCVGYDSPGFGSVEEMSSQMQLDRINASGADFLVVALGARKGQAWIMRNLEHLNVPVISHLGAVLNFVAGTVKRAPTWMQRCGLEWLWRVKEEPSLYKRYVMDGWGFTYLLLRDFRCLLTRTSRPASTCRLSPWKATATNDTQPPTLTVQSAPKGTPYPTMTLEEALCEHLNDDRTVVVKTPKSMLNDARVSALLGIFATRRRANGRDVQLCTVEQSDH